MNEEKSQPGDTARNPRPRIRLGDLTQRNDEGVQGGAGMVMCSDIPLD